MVGYIYGWGIQYHTGHTTLTAHQCHSLFDLLDLPAPGCTKVYKTKHYPNPHTNYSLYYF